MCDNKVNATTVYKQSMYFENVFLDSVPNQLFVKPSNVLFFGNSWLRQIVESILCLLHSSPRYKDIVVRPGISAQKCNASMPFTNDLRDQTCPGYYDLNDVLHQSKNNMSVDFGIPRSDEENYWATTIKPKVEQFWKEQLVDNNVCGCDDSSLHLELADGSNIFYSFQHPEENKSMRATVSELRESGMDAAFEGFDVIIFNLGNHPWYDFSTEFPADLEYLNHSDKPVIFIADGHPFKTLIRAMGKGLKYKQKGNGDLRVKRGCRLIRNVFPNLLLLSERDRIERHVDGEAVPLIGGHYCMPGVPSHHALSLLHLTNLLIEMNQTLKFAV